MNAAAKGKFRSGRSLAGEEHGWDMVQEVIMGWRARDVCVWGWIAHDVCLGMGFANTPRPGVSDLPVDDWA